MLFVVLVSCESMERLVLLGEDDGMDAVAVTAGTKEGVNDANDADVADATDGRTDDAATDGPTADKAEAGGSINRCSSNSIRWDSMLSLLRGLLLLLLLLLFKDSIASCCLSNGFCE